jgi:hypothetical protein
MEDPTEGRPQRMHPAHGVKHVLNAPMIVYVTVCAEKRVPWIAAGAVHRRLIDEWTGSRPSPKA